MRWLAVLSFFLVTSLSAGRPPFVGQLRQGGAPQIAFTDATVEVASLDPNASVTLAGFVIETHDFGRKITTPAFYQHADSKGNLSVAIPGGVQPRSVWILVTHAGYTVASPMGVLTTFDIPAANLTLDTNNRASSVLVPRAHTEVFAIPRPPAGGLPSPVVTFDAKDGSPADADNEINGVAAVFLQAKEGDTLFVVDTRSLECAVVEVRR